MTTWTIKETDTSYRFLTRWHPLFRQHAKDKSSWIPEGFCSYYNAVFEWIMILLLGGLTIPGIMVFLLLYTGYLVPSGSIISLIALCMLSFIGGAATIVGGLLILAFFVFFLAKYFFRYLFKVIDFFVPDNTARDTPSLIGAWIEQKKNKYCMKVEYVKD